MDKLAKFKESLDIYAQKRTYLSEVYLLYRSKYISSETLESLNLIAVQLGAKLIDLSYVKKMYIPFDKDKGDIKDMFKYEFPRTENIFHLCYAVVDFDKKFYSVNPFIARVDEETQHHITYMVGHERITLDRSTSKVIKKIDGHSKGLTTFYEVYFKANSSGRIIKIEKKSKPDKEVVPVKKETIIKEAPVTIRYTIKHDDGRVVSGNTYVEVADKTGEISFKSVGNIIREGRKIKGWFSV